MPSDTAPRVWTHDDAEPPMIPDPPPLRDKYGVRWVADERELDGFAGWRSDSHGFSEWRSWWNLAYERGPLTEDLGTPDAAPVPCPLTTAELETITLAANGLRNPDIAVKLHVSIGTVHQRLHRAATKLGIHGTKHMIAVCMKHGWIKPDDINRHRSPSV